MSAGITSLRLAGDLPIFFAQQEAAANRMAAFTADPGDRVAFDAHWPGPLPTRGAGIDE